MFVVPAIVTLIVLIFLKPQEYFPALRVVPLLYVFMALTVFTMLVDLRLRLIKPAASPQLKWVMMFIGWSILTVVLRAPQDVAGNVVSIAITFVPYFVIAHGIQRFRQLHIIAGTYLALTLLLAVVGVHQNFQRTECISFMGANNDLRPEDPTGAFADGKDCAIEEDCALANPEPGIDYLCERRGLFDTSTIGEGRVRFRGQLNDPNELALTVASGLPFAIGLFLVKRTPFRLLVLLITVVLGSMAVKFTKSRGGLLVLSCVAATYMAQRYGKKALIIGAIVLLPLVMVLSGEKRSDADESREERLELQATGMEIWRTYPITGVGYGQYPQYSYMTTHNSYILVLAELGVPGMTIWVTIIFLSFKVPATALRRYRRREDARVASIWATASISSMAGLCVGIFFLSFYAHFVPWILVGFNGAMSHSIREHEPDWTVKVGRVEVGCAAVGVLIFGAVASLGLRYMTGH
jgi:O-antigen ligase